MGSARANLPVNGAYTSQSGGGGASDQAYQRLHRTTRSDPNYLSPEDATSPPRKFERHVVTSSATATGVQGSGANGVLHGLGVGGASFINRRRRDRTRERSRGSRKKGVWKKLLWVKQSYPDNYTDEETFLDHLQRNPRLQPYEFWPLMADSTVIVQHLCSVAVFVCCFVGIFQDRISPVAVVGWGNVATLLGWALWDRWMAQEDAAAVQREASIAGGEGESTTSSAHSSTLNLAAPRSDSSQVQGLGITMSAPGSEPGKPSSGSDTMPPTSAPSPVVSGHPTGAARFADYSYYPPYGASASPFSPRNQQRIATAKSAALIYCALLGLSPILKSLTKSTSSDSIWAMSCWLMCINVFFFDYGGAVGSKLPASLSTNAALMASTVLASRLPSTTHVFSLTLFSIEVFGLFPIFRRHLRLHSWRGHLLLTFVLVASAGGGVGITISRSGGWKAAVAGVVLGCILTALALGGCIWWLIGLQRYKNEIHGPWDPARPILRRHWD